MYSIDYYYDVNDKRVARTDPGGDWTYYLRNAAGMDIGLFNLTTKDFEWYVFGGGQRLAAVLLPQEFHIKHFDTSKYNCEQLPDRVYGFFRKLSDIDFNKAGQIRKEMPACT